MLNDMERLYRIMSGHGFAAVRAAYIRRALAESGHMRRVRRVFAAAGWEIVPEGEEAGEEAIIVGRERWRLIQSIRDQRRSDAIAQAEQRAKHQPEKKSAVALACMAIIDGQLCGGALTRTPICPRCALGKHGVSATLTCDTCGAVTADMRQK